MLIISIFAALVASLGQVQEEDKVHYGPLGVEAHSVFQLPGVGFVPSMPLQLKADEVVCRTSFSAINVYNAQDDFLLDLEFTRMKFDFWYGVTNKLSFGASLPIERVSGGHLDTLIQNFHEWARLKDHGKNDVRDQLRINVNGENYQVKPHTAFGDLMLSANYEIVKSGCGCDHECVCGGLLFAWYGGVHVKLPTTNSQLYCSWSTGVGLSTNILIQCDGWSLDVGGSVAYLGKGDVLGLKTSPHQEIVFISLERHLCSWAAIVGQAVMQSGLAEDLGQQSKWSYELDLGFKIAISPSTTMTFGAFENVAHFANSADFGVFLGFEYRR